MQPATAFDATPVPPAASRGIGVMLRKLPAAVVVLAALGLLATAALDRSADVTAAPRPVPAPSAAPVVAAAGNTSVPDAGTVFGGREVEIEEPAPTF